MKNKYISVALAAWCISLSSYAQVSYNKRALGSVGVVPNKAGDFQNAASLDNVDMSTGVLKVGIPLYEIKVNDISVPIALNYTASGLKVGQEAGPTGMGWELSAGGKIITNVQGKKDPANSTDLYNKSWASGVLSSPSTFDPIGNYLDHRPFIADVLDNKQDGAWDTYNYILPNGGGTYVRNGLTFPYDPTIDVTTPGTVKTTDGLIYIFTAGITKRNTRRRFFNGIDALATPNDPGFQWNDPPTESTEDFLWKIISSKFKDTVYFDYQRFQQPNALLPAKTRTSTSESIQFNRAVIPRSLTEGGVTSNINDQFYRISEPAVSQSKTEVIYHSRVSTISFPNGRVHFYYGDNNIKGRDVLTDIKIYQKDKTDSTLLKRYHFDYDETNVSYGHYLTTIKVYDGAEVQQGSWDFTYYDKLPLDPTLETRAQDRWGFYNGDTTNRNLLEHPDNVPVIRNRFRYPIFNDDTKSSSKVIYYSKPDAVQTYGYTGAFRDPATDVFKFTMNFANRNFNFNSARMGTLKSVKTPTGGKFEYEYEPHLFTYTRRDWGQSAVNIDLEGGGIRTKSIKRSLGHPLLYNDYYTDTAGRNLVKQYKYGSGTWENSTNNENGRGIGTLPGSVQGNRSSYYDAGGGTSTTDFYNMVLLSHPLNTLSQHNGSYVIYPSVTEYVMKDATESYGKTVYYSDALPEGYRPDFLWDGYYATREDPKFPIAPLSPGVEKQYISGISGIKKYAKNSNGTYRLSEETKYTFQSFDAPQNSANKLVSFFATLAGQLSGPLPATAGMPDYIARDHPFPNAANPGGYMWNRHVSTSTSGGLMDYINNCNIVQDDKTLTYPGKYGYVFLNLNTLSNCIRKTKETNITYDDKGFTLNWTGTNFYYDNPAHLLQTRVATINSKEDSTITRIKYAQDYSTTSGTIGFMKINKLSLADPVEEYTTYKRYGTTAEYLKSAALNTYKEINGSVFSDKVYQMKIGNEQTAYNPSLYIGGGIDTNVYVPQVSYDLYAKGNIHKYAENRRQGNVVIWGYGNQYPIARVSNTENFSGNSSIDVAYTSFERSDNGNWNYAGTPVTDLSAPSGKKVYPIATGSITKANLSSGTLRYVISYWYKNGASFSFSGGTFSNPVVKNNWGDWKFAEREVSNITGTVTITGTGFIDELRFYPAGSQMSTYTYEPLIGISGVIDTKGGLQFYEYDDSQRLKNIKDQNGNIVKSYRYKMGTLN